MPTAPVKSSPLSFGRTPGEMRRFNKRIILGITIVVVGSILIADGFLACRYLQKRELANNGGCPANCVASLVQSVTPAAAPTSASTAPSMVPADVSALGATYQHGAVGLSFNYPLQWGDVAIKEESGRAADGTNITSGLTLSFIKFSNEDSPAAFLYASNIGAELVSRTGRWSSDGAQIFSDEVIENWCSGRSGCSIFMNSRGMLMARVKSETTADDGTTRQVDTYYMFNPNSGYGGVVLSNQLLAERGVADYARLFAQLVDSIAPLQN